MATARKNLINFNDTTVYHCMTRCVRRARLCGQDTVSGINYNHRRSWVEQRLLILQRVFAVNILAYAVMPNHTHILIHVDVKTAESYCDDEVLRRWHILYKGTHLTQQYLRCGGAGMSEIEKEAVRSTAAIWRKRLASVSWFMRTINEYIAKKANKEDNCTGHFWEGRFKSQAILDEAALLACMLYIDLNPLRAGLATTPESSDFTSLTRRLKNFEKQSASKPAFLFEGNTAAETLIPVTFKQYLLLIDETAKFTLQGKCSLNAHLLPVMERIDVEFKQFMKTSRAFEQVFCHIAGNPVSMKNNAQKYTRRKLAGTYCLVKG